MLILGGIKANALVYVVISASCLLLLIPVMKCNERCKTLNAYRALSGVKKSYSGKGS
jgi:hypothetical protein